MAVQARQAVRTVRRNGAAVGLFAGSAAVVVWQLSRVAVLWDLSAILETSARIAAGDAAYRRFPLMYPPGTFYIQAAIIRLFGSHYLLHGLYAAAVSGLATCVTLRIVRLVLGDGRHRRLAVVLALPLIPLGIYSVLPHPFYDPDACFAMLVALWAVLAARARGFPPARSVLAGVVCVAPLFVKQNVGLAFLVLTHSALAVSLLAGRDRRSRVAYGWVAAGSLAALAAGALALQAAFGLGPYLHWTVRVAARERFRGNGFGLGMYLWPSSLVSAALVGGGVVVARRGRGPASALAAAGLLVAPSLWFAGRALHQPDAVLAFWPFVLLVSGAVGAAGFVRGARTFPQLVPLVCAGVAHSAFVSLDLDGSSYGIWPLLVVAFAVLVANVDRLVPPRRSRVVAVFAAGTVAALSLAGLVYVASEERLAYADVASGPLHRSTVPALRGLSARGDTVPRLDEVIRYVDEHVPPSEPMVVIPGEDPIHFALRRRDRFPVRLFDNTTTNPYSPAELRRFADRIGVRWVLVKQQLQLDGLPAPLEPTIAALTDGFDVVARPGAYVVYRRPPTAPAPAEPGGPPPTSTASDQAGAVNGRPGASR